jgi:glycine cleavage system H lipoate-binding protein
MALANIDTAASGKNLSKGAGEMNDKLKERRRSLIGYGSSYRKGRGRDLEHPSEIGTVLGGQVWMVKPDKKAEAGNPCIWMQTGVAGFKDCNNFYDCTTCKYDLGMRKKARDHKQMSWQEAMRTKPGLERVCRHTLTQRIGNRACAYDYECSTCDFDQFFEEVWSTKTKSIPREVQTVRGFKVPTGYFFHDGHTWMRIESGGYVRVGMDDFALKLLGKADGYDLPLMGKELDKDKVGWGFKRTKNQADVLSPVDGVIVEVNPEVREKPEIANQEPYEGGWLFMVHTPDIKGAAKKLMSHTEGMPWIKSEVNILENMIEEVAGPLPSDGGFLAEDIYGHLPDLGWSDLTRTFLKT